MWSLTPRMSGGIHNNQERINVLRRSCAVSDATNRPTSRTTHPPFLLPLLASETTWAQAQDRSSHLLDDLSVIWTTTSRIPPPSRRAILEPRAHGGVETFLPLNALTMQRLPPTREICCEMEMGQPLFICQILTRRRLLHLPIFLCQPDRLFDPLPHGTSLHPVIWFLYS